MSPRRLRTFAGSAALLTSLLVASVPSPVFAQTLGTFPWQIAPYCNVVTFAISVDGAGFRLTGFDNQCGGAQLPAAGAVTLRNDGQYGLSFYVVTPTGLTSHVTAVLNPASISGPWQDSSGNAGTLAFNPVAPAGAPRPAPVVSTLALADGAITTAKVGVAAVDSARLADGSVSTVDLADGAVTGTKIGVGAVDSARILDGSVGTVDLADAAVTGAKIGVGVVDSARILDGSVGTVDLADAAVTSDKVFLPFAKNIDAAGSAFSITNLDNDGIGVRGAASGGGTGVLGVSNASGGTGVLGTSSNGNSTAVLGRTESGSTGNAGRFENLDAASNAAVLRVENATGASGDLIRALEDADVRFRVRVDGTVNADGTITGGGADVAEFIDTTDTVEAGDVIEIDAARAGRFRRATSPSSPAVAGVITTKPAVLMNASDDREDLTEGPAIALAGRVPVKVCAENGAIVPGDLLVSSSTPGHAMKAPAAAAQGTVIGKALGVLASGTGVIEMLVMLR